MAGVSGLVKYGALGALGWWLYNRYVSSAVLTTAPPAGAAPAAPGATVVPTATGSTVPPSVAVAVPRPLQPLPPVTATPPAATPPAPPASSTLDAIFSRMVGGATNSGGNAAAGLTPDQWNWFLNQTSPAIGPAPDPLLVFPGVDRSQPMYAGVYWASMAPYLREHLGLAGLGHFGAIGALYRRSRAA